MCGRFTLFDDSSLLAEWFGLEQAPSLSPRYNIAPSQEVAAVRVPPGGEGRELALLRWGLVPSWAKDPSLGARMINARAETAADKPAFRSAIRRRRCLVPADGFYEWKRVNGRKQPYYVRMRDAKVFGLAAIWEAWSGADEEPIESCALLTTSANALLRPIHDRMPVIVRPSAYGLWLSPGEQDPQALAPLLHPWPDGEMVAYPVSASVNNPKMDGPGLTEPVR
ncbi:MAG TPA: SOS response-associated peptidase [Candidatus Aquicultoraceae bacterium]|nr:SOS response-associated peptidase [Candidatus Aquicultoraceae bacterium]